MVSWPFPFGDQPDGTYRSIGEPAVALEEIASPSPSEVPPLHSKPRVKANVPDWASDALREAGKCPDARSRLCAQYGIDYATLVEGAPNAGVATMRIVNALRRSSKS